MPDATEGSDTVGGSGGSPGATGNAAVAFGLGFVAGVAVGVAVTLAVVGGSDDNAMAGDNQPGITADAGASPSNEPVPQ